MRKKRTKVTKPVQLLGLRDYMYPEYNFLKQRLLSIYPRFKTVIERGQLDQLVPDGVQLMNDIKDAIDPLVDTVTVFLLGRHARIKEADIKKNFIASLKCGKEDFIRKDKVEIIECKNISAKPCVIVYAVPTTSGKIKSFDDVTKEMTSLVSETGEKSCIVCTDSCHECDTLYHVLKKSCLERNSVGKLIQSCLKEKALAVLQKMSDFLQQHVFQRHWQFDTVYQRTGGLKQAVLKSLKAGVSEIQGSNSTVTIMHRYLCLNIQKEICENLSIRSEVKENLIKKAMEHEGLDRVIKDCLDEIPELFQKPVSDHDSLCSEYMAKIKDHLKNFEEAVLQKFRSLSEIGYEIDGVFRQAQLPVHKVPHISTALQKSILGIHGVFGCGVMLGNLVVHVKENEKADLQEIENKVVDAVMDSDSPYFVNHLEVKRVQLLMYAGACMKHESGQCIRVRKMDTDGEYERGTLGCFVNGHVEGANEQLYGISCAHVFPDHCGPIVEVAHDGSPTKFEVIGEFSRDFSILMEHKVDIAAFKVNSSARQKCHLGLKNSQLFDYWKTDIYSGDLKQLENCHVYKCGAETGQTEGMIISMDYASCGLTGFDDQHNFLIGNLPKSKGPPFSLPGDSGSVVCFDNATEETVHVLSLINGGMKDTKTGNWLCSYSCHLKMNLTALSSQTNITYELCNHQV